MFADDLLDQRRYAGFLTIFFDVVSGQPRAKSKENEAAGVTTAPARHSRQSSGTTEQH